ncbi:hypothetical protein JOQ06_007674, partial [Pogonophryne albipinna]
MASDIDRQNQGSIDVIKAEHQAALSGQRELQAQIKEAHLAIHSYTATEEMLIAMKREKEETIKENVSLEKELKCLKERHNHLQVIKELYQLAKTEKQTVCQQNEALLQEVMDLCKKLENESIVQNEMDAMNASINEGNRQTDILQMHIFELAQRLLRLEDLQTSYNIAMAEKELISQQNQFLLQKNREFSRDLENEQTIKVKYETLNASNNAQRRDNDTMKKTLAEAQEKLAREADWQQKYIMAGHRRDCLEREHKKLSEDVQLFQGKLTSQGDLKKSYTTMEAKQGPEGTLRAVVIQERRLHVGVHNGWCFWDKPQVVVLEPLARSRSDSSSKQSSLVKDSSTTSPPPQMLGLRSSLELKLTNHQALAIVFQLEFVFSAPIGRETMLSVTSTSRAAFLQCVRWGIWFPFQEPADWKGEEIQIVLRGGAKPNPHGVMVYSTEMSAKTQSPVTLSPPGSAQEGKDTITFRLSSSLERKTSSPKASLRTKQEEVSRQRNIPPASPPDSPQGPGTTFRGEQLSLFASVDDDLSHGAALMFQGHALVLSTQVVPKPLGR